MSVRLWDISMLQVGNSAPGGRRLEHLFSLSGHSDTVLCLDICTEFSLLVSGSADRCVCLYSFFSFSNLLTPMFVCFLFILLN